MMKVGFVGCGEARSTRWSNGSTPTTWRRCSTRARYMGKKYSGKPISAKIW